MGALSMLCWRKVKSVTCLLSVRLCCSTMTACVPEGNDCVAVDMSHCTVCSRSDPTLHDSKLHVGVCAAAACVLVCVLQTWQEWGLD